MNKKIISSALSVALTATVLIIALLANTFSLAWFSENKETAATGMLLSSSDYKWYESARFYRNTEMTVLSDEGGAKYNEYGFSYEEDGLYLGEERERDSFEVPIEMLPYSDLSGNCQILIEITMATQDPFVLIITSNTEEYLGNVIYDSRISGTFNIMPTGLPLSSAVHFAILSDIENDKENSRFLIDDKHIAEHDISFLNLTDVDNPSFANPLADGMLVTPNEDNKFYIYLDYYVDSVEIINYQILEYVDAATAKNENYNTITIGETNLFFTPDFFFDVKEGT